MATCLTSEHRLNNTVEVNQQRFVAVGSMTGLRFSFTATGEYCRFKGCISVVIKVV